MCCDVWCALIVVNPGRGEDGIPIPTVDGINFVDPHVSLGTVSIAQ